MSIYNKLDEILKDYPQDTHISEISKYIVDKDIYDWNSNTIEYCMAENILKCKMFKVHQVMLNIFKYAEYPQWLKKISESSTVKEFHDKYDGKPSYKRNINTQTFEYTMLDNLGVVELEFKHITPLDSKQGQYIYSFKGEDLEASFRFTDVDEYLDTNHTVLLFDNISIFMYPKIFKLVYSLYKHTKKLC